MNFKYQYLRLLSLLLLVALGLAQQCSPNDEEFFVSFHPHLDAFWLNTDDELKDFNFRPASFLFAMNQRNSKTIFNSMYSALDINPSRKYFVTQVVFFKDWYDFISPQMRQKVKKFISSGQLEITNGGWVENDEAVCYIDDIIDQYTIGHNYLRQTFGLQTKIGWATDSFGHSHSQAAIQHLLGFQIQGIQRIDDRYIYNRKNGSLLQFYWSAVSDSNGRKYGGVYTHIRHFLHQFVDYRNERGESLANDYGGVNAIMTKLYKKQKLFRFVGNDFEQFIPQQFSTLQSAFTILNSKISSKCAKFKYGNPSDYFKAVQSEQKGPVSVREGDFMPNFDQDHYWAGYFTTNPMLKVVCKDFSRLTNLFRKLYLKNSLKKRIEDESLSKLLKDADQLLAVMQHHDGITATSKYHIEQLFKERMTRTSQNIFKAISGWSKISEIRCIYDQNMKNCNIQPLSNNNAIYLTILHQGAEKTQRIEIQLPTGKHFQAEADSQDSIFCNQLNVCSLVFEAVLIAGENTFKLIKLNDKNKNILFKTLKQNGPKFIGSQFTVEIAESTIKYILKNGDFINLSLVRSLNTVTTVDTETWNKYGQSQRKNERRIPGIYIMSNAGVLADFPESKFVSLRVIEGKRHSKIWAVNQIGQVIVTIDNKELSILDVHTFFKPNSFTMYDYFLKISSPIDSNGEFYHDVNGYLVSKRRIGQRLDYEWIYRQQDKINANTYPMCTFGYVTDGTKKLVIFTDRAQGFTTYDNDLLINIDRIAGDDYKGVGQGYNAHISNIFKHRIALIASTQTHERLWQRHYDQLAIGFLSSTEPKKTSKSRSTTNQQDHLWIKYSTFCLNKDEFVIRIFNMNDKKSIKLKKYTANNWNLPELGLQLQFESIAETFANGNPISKRKQWIKIQGQINAFKASSQDSSKEITFEPLQIRSFRIKLSDKLPFNTLNRQETQQQPTNKLPQLRLKPSGSHFDRRCF